MELPSDLLGEIFMLVDSHDIDQKFWLGQVCSYWRTTALGVSLLWTRLAVMTPLDAARLPTVLERSTLQVLDIKLLWQSRYKQRLLSPAERSTVVDALVAQRERILRLYVTYEYQQPGPLPHLFGEGLEFPVLQDLEICGPQGGEYFPWMTVSLSAPLLRRLFFTRLNIHDWGQLLSPSLSQLFLKTCTPDANVTLVPTIFRLCSHLQHLKLLTYDGPLLSSGFTLDATQLVPHLRTLDLRVDVLDITTLLRGAFGNTVLYEIDACTINGFIDDDVQRLMAELFRGVGPLVELHVVYDQDIVLRDNAGRMRRMRVWNDDSSWEWPDVWIELATRYGLHASVRVVRFPTTEWNKIAAAFAAKPTEAQGVELYVNLNCDFVDNDSDSDEEEDDGEHVEPGPRRLLCSNLRLVKFQDCGDYEGDSGGSRADLVRRLLHSIDCGAAHVEVCVADAGLDKDESRTSLARFRDELTGFPGAKWTMCGHCVELV